MPGPALYAQTSDMQAYLPDVPAAQQGTWAGFLAVASRSIDDWCERYFYADGTATKYFDVPGATDPGASPVTMLELFDHDFYTLTALKVALRENGDPALASDWIQLTGDGITPPSDFFLGPANQVYVGKDGDSNKRPFYKIEIPKTSPATSGTYQASFMPGRRTVSIAANWGWPSVPDQIKDICTKIAIRLYKASPTGFTGQTGAPDVPGSSLILSYTDMNDRVTLNRFKKYSA